MDTLYYLPYPVFINDPTNSLLGGALGSFVGAFIILGIERTLDLFIKKYKQEKEKRGIENALNIEITNNLSICEEAITSLTPAHHSIFIFAKFKTLWLEKYCNMFIDYGDSDSLRLYSFLAGVKTVMERFETTQNLQHGLSSSSRALMNFNDLAYKNNQIMLASAKELQSILKAVKALRKDNKVYFEDVKSHPDSNSKSKNI